MNNTVTVQRVLPRPCNSFNNNAIPNSNVLYHYQTEINMANVLCMSIYSKLLITVNKVAMSSKRNN